MIRELKRPMQRQAPEDLGLLEWVKTLTSALEQQQGVEIIGSAGGTVMFQFRGQQFTVTVHRTS